MKKSEKVRLIIERQCTSIEEKTIIKYIEQLEHFKDSVCGLYAIDKDPITVSHIWIIDNAIRIKFK